MQNTRPHYQALLHTIASLFHIAKRLGARNWAASYRLFLSLYCSVARSYTDYKSCMYVCVYTVMHFLSGQCCGGYYSALTESNLPPPLLLARVIWLAYKPHCSERKPNSSADWPEQATVSGLRHRVSVCKGLFVPFSSGLVGDLSV